jgi:multidrug efflux system membrane fusion protein
LIPDGISAEVAIPVKPTPAVRVPRSALTIASTGDIGVRTVGEDGIVAFNRVGIVEDEQTFMWVVGVRDGDRVIVQGQDFVREGQTVEAVAAAEVTATVK